MNYVRLGDICSQESEKLKTKTDVLIDYIDISSVDNISKSIIRHQQLLSSDAPSRAQRIVEVGDILVSTVRPNLNAVAIYEKKLDNLAVASTGFCVLRCHRNISRRFVFNFCKSPNFINALTNQATGASYPAVNDAIIREVLIPSYTYEKQVEIAQILDLVQKIIDLKKKEIVSFDNLIKARFVEMFENVTYRKVPLIETIREGAGLSYGIVVPGNNVKNGIPMIRPSDFKNSTLDLSNVYKVEPEIECKYAKTRLLGDEILVQVIGQPGQVMLATDQCRGMNVTRNLAVIRPNHKIINRYYLKQYIEKEDSQQQLLKNTKQSTLKQLPLSLLKKLEIQVPPIDLQNQFADFVQQVDKSKVAVQKSLEQTKLLFDSLMQQYFG